MFSRSIIKSINLSRLALSTSTRPCSFYDKNSKILLNFGIVRSFSDKTTPETPTKTDAIEEWSLEEPAASPRLKEVTLGKNTFVVGPIKVSRSHIDRDKRSHRGGVRDVADGVTGEQPFEFVDPKAVNYPTIETLKELFGGIPYAELPEVRIHLSKNNTKVYVWDYKGSLIFNTSAGMEGFKNCKKKTEVAGQTVGFSTGNKCKRHGLKHVRIILKGLGPGRHSCVQGISMTGVNVVSISDVSPVPEKGPRPRKSRRL